MNALYSLFVFLHVTAVIVWIGGLVTLAVLNARLAGGGEPAAVATLAGFSRFIGTRVLGPAAGVTLIAGAASVFAGGIGMPFWIVWGLGAMVLSGALGATLLRRTAMEIDNGIAEGQQVSDAALLPLQRRLTRLHVINALLLLSAVWAMVAKPTL